LMKHAAARRENKVDKVDKFLNEFDSTGTLRQDIGQLDGAIKEVQHAVIELRNAMRLDEVANALERSLNALSVEQKKGLETLSASVGKNLDRLQKSVQELDQNNGKNTKGTQLMLERLSKALSSLSTNQAGIAKELNANLIKMSGNFNVTTENSLKVVKSILANYKQATDEMIRRLNDTRDANTKLVAANEELVKSNDSMKQELTLMGDTLSKFITDQETKEKIRTRYLIAVVAIISLIGGLLFFSVVFK
jgi:Ni,Fe-hydrogenase I large subunit